MCVSEMSAPRTLVELTERFSDEKVCREYLAKLRWNGQPVCQHCGHSGKIYRLAKDYKCAKCLKKFSVIKGTIFEDSKLPLSKWFVALYLITAHKKGISSLQLGRDLGVTQKTAWFMLHRIRYALRAKSFEAQALTGVVEADETYVGGKEKNKHKSKRVKGTQGRSTKVKAPVFGLVQRGGRVVAMTVESTTEKELKPIITKHVMLGAKIMTDEWVAYARLNNLYDHSVVRHGQGEYVSGEAHTNTIEGFWSLLKRGIVGIYHNVSVKHLNKYVGEFQFRYNSRKETEADRFEQSIGQIQGRLTYKELINLR